MTETIETELAPEVKEAIRRYAGSAVFEREILKIEVFSEYGSTDWTLADFLSDMNEAVAKIPEQYRTVAEVTLEGDYDEYTKLIIRFKRPETDAEYETRIRDLVSQIERDKTQRAIAERKEYERLKAKYG